MTRKVAIGKIRRIEETIPLYQEYIKEHDTAIGVLDHIASKLNLSRSTVAESISFYNRLTQTGVWEIAKEENWTSDRIKQWILKYNIRLESENDRNKIMEEKHKLEIEKIRETRKQLDDIISRQRMMPQKIKEFEDAVKDKMTEIQNKIAQSGLDSDEQKVLYDEGMYEELQTWLDSNKDQFKDVIDYKTANNQLLFPIDNE